MPDAPPDRAADPASRAADPARLPARFRALPAAVAAEIEAAVRLHVVPRNAVVIAMGDEAGPVGWVQDGMLAMRRGGTGRASHIIGLLGPGDLIGRLAPGPAICDLVALTEARLAIPDRDRLADVLRRAPEAEAAWLDALLDDLDGAREWLVMLGGRRIVTRTAAFLAMLHARQAREAAATERGAAPRTGPRNAQGAAPPARGRGATLHIPLSRADLALHLGARPETLSRSLHELRRRGVIAIPEPNGVEILNLDALTKIAGTDTQAHLREGGRADG